MNQPGSTEMGFLVRSFCRHQSPAATGDTEFSLGLHGESCPTICTLLGYSVQLFLQLLLRPVIISIFARPRAAEPSYRSTSFMMLVKYLLRFLGSYIRAVSLLSVRCQEEAEY